MPKHELIMISAGEASGDHHAALALTALREQGVSFEAFGMGAGKLEKLGVSIDVDCRSLAVIGFVDALLNYHKFRLRIHRLRKLMKTRKPDLLVIVDYPDFNLKLAKTAQQLGIPVLFYISPQVWAWRTKRVTKIARLVNHMAVIFPFEEKFYADANVPVTYVGHPLVDSARCDLTQAEARVALKLSTDKLIVALLPGSRNGELSRILPIMLDSARALLTHLPNTEFVVPCAPTLNLQIVEEMIRAAQLPITLIEGQTCPVLRSADAALTASGTATLETALMGTPMAVVYRMNRINYALMSRMIQIDHIGLVNIVAEQGIVQEFVQDNAQAVPIATELSRLLTDKPYRTTMQENLAEVTLRMGSGGASRNVATLIQSILSR